MTDLRQAAQQALEALKTCDEDEWHDEDDFGMVQTYDEDKVAKAITALQAALEQPDQEQQIETLKRCLFQMQEAAKNLVEQEKSLTPPQRTEQEPVAWMVKLGDVTCFQHHADSKHASVPLYTAPPAAQRPWIGLTEEDWVKIGDMPDTWDQGAAWAAARLKERNT
jgi:hypothetical protein